MATGLSFADALPISPSNNVSSFVSPTELNRYFVFDTIVGATYTFETNSSYDLYGYVYDANQTQIAYDDDAGVGYNPKVTFTATTTKSYAKIRGYSTPSTTYNFTAVLTLTNDPTAGDANFPNAVTIPMGTIYTTTITSGIESSRNFKFATTPGTRYTVELSTSSYLDLRVYNATPLEQGSSVVLANGKAVVTFIANSATSYAVVGFAGGMYNGSYEFTIGVYVAGPPTAYDGVVVPKNGYATYTIPSAQYYCYFSIPVEAGKRYLFYTTSYGGATGRTNVGYLYDTNKNVIGSSDGAYYGNPLFDFVATQTGTMYAVVYTKSTIFPVNITAYLEVKLTGLEIVEQSITINGTAKVLATIQPVPADAYGVSLSYQIDNAAALKTIYDSKTSRYYLAGVRPGTANFRVYDYNTVTGNYTYSRYVAVTVTEPTYFSAGDGTVGNPFLITCIMDLINVTNANYCYFKQVVDIDLIGYEFPPIAEFGYWDSFRGTYDGNKHWIRNYARSADVPYTGLFLSAEGAHFKNMLIENFDIKGRNYIALLVGEAYDCTFDDCNVHGTISTAVSGYYAWGAGGFVGESYGVVFRRCVANVTINIPNGEALGGFVGDCYSNTANGHFEECYSNGTINGQSYCGGLVGGCGDNSFLNCYADTTINGNERLGGLVGNSYGGLTITNSYSACLITATTAVSIGGIIGYPDATDIITSCYYNLERINQAVNALGAPKTSAEIQKKATFVDWDFVLVWFLDEDKDNPRFLWQIVITDIKCKAIPFPPLMKLMTLG